MIRLADPYQPQARVVLGAASGGSTSTTCSSCVVTLLASGVVAEMAFAAAARRQGEAGQPQTADMAAQADPDAAPQPAPDRAARAARVPGLGLLVPVMLGLATWMSLYGGSGLLIPLALGGVVALFVYACDRAGSGRGAWVGIAFVLGVALATALEMFVWMSSL